MRKLLSLAILAIALVSCKKEQANSENTLVDNNMSTKVFEKEPLNPAGDLRKYYDNGGNNYGCNDEKGNCLPDVIIRPSAISGFNNALAALQNTNAITAKSNVLNKNKALLEQYIDGRVLQYALNGEYKVQVKGTDPNQTRYLIFTSATNGNIAAVYPITTTKQ